jgi:hypothetical protein
MADAEQLVNLRSLPDWPSKKLDLLAAEAAAKGRLIEAVWEADRQMGYRVKPDSNSDVTISEFSHLDSRSDYWYQRLWLELHRVLGRAPSTEWDDAG